MKPMEIAKNVWKHAFVVQERIDRGELPQYSVLFHYFGMLTMYASDQAAYYSGDNQWLMQVKGMHIDHCFIDNTIIPVSQKIIDDTIDNKFPSDHYGLYIKLNLE